jgi:type I restriction enzyme M protein
MMNEMKLDYSVPVEAITSKLWPAFDILRNEHFAAEDYYVILFLITVYKDGYLLRDRNLKAHNIKSIIINRVSNSEEHNNEQVQGIFQEFHHSLDRLSDRGLHEIIDVLFNLDVEELKLHFTDVFDNVLYKLAKSQGRHTGEFIQPIELSRLVINLAGLEANSKVFNPFAGAASFGVFLENSHNYYGQEISPITWAIGALRVLAYNKSLQAKFVKEDSIHQWPELNQKFDLVVSTPPFGLKLDEDLKLLFPDCRTAEQFFIRKGVSSLSNKGKLIAILPIGFLFRSGSDQQVRQFLVESDLVEFVIELPGGLLSNTSLPLAILVLNKAKKAPGLVKFINAKNYLVRDTIREKKLNDSGLLNDIRKNETTDTIKIVSNTQITELGYNLSVPRYFQKKYDGVELRNLGTFIKGTRVSDNQKGKLVQTRDLKDDILDFELNLALLEDTEIPKQAIEVSESCLLLASRWKTLKPTYFRYAGTPVYIMPDTLTYKVDESKCDLAYLVNELHANYVFEQLDTFRTGSVIPFIKKDDLLSIVISIPFLDKQKSIVKQRLIELSEEKKKELNLFNKIYGLESEIIEQNTYLRHTLAGPSSNLKDSISSIKKIFYEKVVPAHPHILNLKLSDKHMISLGEYLSIIERDAQKIVSTVTSQLKVDTGIDHKKLIPFEIFNFLEKYAAEYNERLDINFKIDFDFDENVFMDEDGKRVQTFIMANYDLLRDLFDNLINNAAKHAFLPESKNLIEIYLMKNKKNEDQDEIQILFSNTGKPLPKDFTVADFIRKGFKSGPNAGEGFGGWYINEIIKKLNGDFDVIDETGSEGLIGTDLVTSFEINFPIIKVDGNV